MIDSPSRFFKPARISIDSELWPHTWTGRFSTFPLGPPTSSTARPCFSRTALTGTTRTSSSGTGIAGAWESSATGAFASATTQDCCRARR